jgi:hypothetical protein
MKTFVKNECQRNSWINKALLAEQIKRFWVIPAMTLVVFIVGIVFPIYSANPHSWNSPERLMVALLTMNNSWFIMATVIVPLFAAMALFTHHFNGTANTAFTGFPISKRQLFLTNLTAGVLMFAIPLLILCLILLVPVRLSTWVVPNRPPSHLWSTYIWPGLMHRGRTINTFPVVAGFFGRAMLSFVFYFALGVLGVSVTGNRIAAGKVVLIIAFLPFVMFMFVFAVAIMYVFGINVTAVFSDNMMMNSVSFVNAHPVSMGTLISNQGAMDFFIINAMWQLYLIYFLIAAGMLTLGMFCCLRRRAERAGDMIAFAPLKNILVFIMALAGMVFGGVLYMWFFNSRFGYYLGFVVGFVLLYFIGHMIVEKTFHVFAKIKKLPLFGGIALGIYLLMLFITRGAMWGYVSYVPHANDVQGVYIWHMWPNPHTENFVEGRDFVFVTDRSIIARTVHAHEQIVSQRRVLRRYGIWNELMNQRSGTWTTQRVPIIYRLQCGKLVSRMYNLPQDFIESSGLGTLRREEAVILSTRPELLDPSLIERIIINFEFESSDSRTEIIVTDRTRVLSLAEALRRDYVNGWENSNYWHDNNGISATLVLYEKPEWAKYMVYWPYLWINDATHTIAWLRLHNLDKG